MEEMIPALSPEKIIRKIQKNNIYESVFEDCKMLIIVQTLHLIWEFFLQIPTMSWHVNSLLRIIPLLMNLLKYLRN